MHDYIANSRNTSSVLLNTAWLVRFTRIKRELLKGNLLTLIVTLAIVDSDYVAQTNLLLTVHQVFVLTEA